MCYAGHCNPECNNCSPQELVVVHCPQCHARNSLTRTQYLNGLDLPHKQSIQEKKTLKSGMKISFQCSECSMDLTETYRAAIPAAPCKRLGIICGFPCGRRKEEPTDTNQVCNTMVPIKRIEITDA